MQSGNPFKRTCLSELTPQLLPLFIDIFFASLCLSRRLGRFFLSSSAGRDKISRFQLTRCWIEGKTPHACLVSHACTSIRLCGVVTPSSKFNRDVLYEIQSSKRFNPIGRDGVGGDIWGGSRGPKSMQWLSPITEIVRQSHASNPR